MNATPSTPADLRPAPSIILALHSRYETIWDQHHLCDVAQPAAAKCRSDEQKRDFHGFEHAMARLRDESDAVREAILFQVPETFDQAAIYAYHADSAADDAACDPTKVNCERVDLAVKTLFHFLSKHADPRLAEAARMYSHAVQIAAVRGNRLLGIGEATA